MLNFGASKPRVKGGPGPPGPPLDPHLLMWDSPMSCLFSPNILVNIFSGRITKSNLSHSFLKDTVSILTRSSQLNLSWIRFQNERKIPPTKP